MFKGRTTIDIVIILLSLTVASVLIIACFGVLAMRLVHPEADVSAGARSIGRMVEMLVTALIGFVGGRAQGKYEAANGKLNGETNK